MLCSHDHFKSQKHQLPGAFHVISLFPLFTFHASKDPNRDDGTNRRDRRRRWAAVFARASLLNKMLYVEGC